MAISTFYIIYFTGFKFSMKIKLDLNNRILFSSKFQTVKKKILGIIHQKERKKENRSTKPLSFSCKIYQTHRSIYKNLENKQ